MISFVIPVYNADIQLLFRSINSILKSNDKEIEIIVVDDGSHDKNSSAYKRLCNTDQRIKYYKKENGGPSSARNFGVSKAKNEYAVFVDADDYITGTCIAQAKKIICAEHPDLVMGYVYKDIHDEGNGRCRIQPDDNHPGVIILEDDSRKAALLNHILGYPNRVLSDQKGYLSDGPCCRIFRRSLFEDINFDVIPKWNEDTLWNINLISRCSRIAVCKSVWYIYAVRSGSVTQGYRPDCYEEFIYITSQIYLQSRRLWKDAVEKGVSQRIWHDIFIFSRMYLFNPKNRDNFFARYRVMKQAVKSECYQRAVYHADFKYEHRFARRKVKEILNDSIKMHAYFITYLILMIYSRDR